ncbi:MAG: nucleotidyltransferase family protein [Eubacterium sp.]
MFYEDARTVVALLAFVLDGSKPKIKPESIGWEQVFKIARQHSVAGMVCYGIEKLPLEKRPSAEIMKRFQQEKWKGIAKEAIQHISTEEILEALEAAKIRALPLKGYILKNSYPRPDMRVMADVDVLVDDANTKAVKELMLERGYSCENEGGNHDVYYRKPYMNVEVHRNILPEKHDLNGCFEGIFERTKKSGVYHYIKEMTPEDFYIYSLAHLKKHYAQGGTGIRSIMDLWVFKTDFRKKADWNVIEKELKKVGLYHFEEKLLHLAAVWFGVEEGDAEAQEIECFIFKNGVA